MKYRLIIEYLDSYSLEWLRACFSVVYARQAGAGRWFVLMEVGG